MTVDLNSDLGESFGAYTIGNDSAIIPLISSANVACGFHAGDPTVMARTVKLCRESGTALGAHPGFMDLQGFGRRNMNISPEEAKALVIYQVGALSAFAASEGVKLQHVKPHGALYNMAGKDYALARAITEGVKSVDSGLTMLVLSGSQMEKAAKDLGMKYAAEVFADRAYEPDGSLVARSKEGSMITDEDEAVRRVIRMVKEGRVTAIDGCDIPITADSVCVHGDGAKALLFVQKLKTALEEAGITIAPFGRN